VASIPGRDEEGIFYLGYRAHPAFSPVDTVC